MPICPKCKKEINDLDYYCKVGQRHVFDGEDYDLQEEGVDKYEEEYSCPMCKKILFKDEDVAKDFLKQK